MKVCYKSIGMAAKKYKGGQKDGQKGRTNFGERADKPPKSDVLNRGGITI